MKNNKKVLLGLSAVALTSVALVSCGGNTTSSSLTVCLASEPQTLDPALNSAVDGATLLVHLDSGLYRYVQKANSTDLELVYDLASNITKTTAQVVDHEENEDGSWSAVTYPEGTRYTVTIRDDAKWSDGSDLTADDFIYSWNRASSASLGADYCYMFEQICDGYAHECDDEQFPSLGIKKVSDKVFTIDLMVDVAFFDQLLAFPTYFPVKKSLVEQYDTAEDGAWATEASRWVSNGAYTMAEWEHNSYIKLKKNPNYWNAKNITLDEITFALSDDDNAILASYQSGAYQMIDSVPNDQIDALKAAYPDEFVIAGQMGTYYVSFNINSTAFSKADTEEKRVKVRKALGLFIDREYIVKEIGKAGQQPANAFVSSGISDAKGGEFVDHNGVNGDGSGYYNTGETDAAYKANVDEAIRLLQEVGYTYDAATGKFTDFDTFKYLYNTSSSHQAIAYNIRDTLAQYGITMNCENQDWSTFLQTRKEGNYDVARNGWVADYDDPSSYLSMWTTQSGNNDTQFGKGAHANYAGYELDLNQNGVIEANEKGLTWPQSYDVLMDRSNKETDPAKRFEMLHDIETLLMSTGAICPVYYYTDIYMIKTNVEGFFSSPLGYKFFMYCTVK